MLNSCRDEWAQNSRCRLLKSRNNMKVRDLWCLQRSAPYLTCRPIYVPPINYPPIAWHISTDGCTQGDGEMQRAMLQVHRGTPHVHASRLLGLFQKADELPNIAHTSPTTPIPKSPQLAQLHLTRMIGSVSTEK